MVQAGHRPGWRPGMKIAVIGTGHIGGTLGQRWHAAGHDVAYGSRKGSGTGPGGARVTPVADALTGAEVVLLAVPGGGRGGGGPRRGPGWQGTHRGWVRAARVGPAGNRTGFTESGGAPSRFCMACIASPRLLV